MLNVLSLFDGMSCGALALERAGFTFKYYASEVDKYAIQVSEDNWEGVTRLGDVTKWREWDIDWSSINLILAGSPCQGFSFAGKQLAFDDSRSALFFEFVNILNHVESLNSDVLFLLENVKMKKEFLEIINRHVGLEPIVINSSLVSAQNRERYYWCNWHVDQPEDKGVTWGDVREYGLNEYYYTEKSLQWLGRHSQRKNKTLTVHADDEKMQMLEASHCKNYSSQRFFGVCDIPNKKEYVAALRGRYLVNGKRQDGKVSTKNNTQQYVEFRYDGKANALTTVTKDNVIVPFTLPNRIPANMFFFRYLSVVECERLQTVPDGYTSSVSKTQRYKMLGNGWTVDVIAHILQHLKQELIL
jgi:DNA-cytosine methyltransferase